MESDRNGEDCPMLAAPYVDAVGRMDRRFVTTSVVPTMIFVTAYGAVAISSWWSFTSASTWLSSLSVAEQILLGFVAGALVWFSASLMSSNWRKIVRLFEGYPMMRWLNRGRRRARIDHRFVPGVAFHLRQKDRLASTNATLFYFRYPLRHDADTLPTTVGNIMLAGERYGVDRYGFETNVLWTRFAWCLPENVQISLDQFKEEHQLPLSLSFTSACFALASGATVTMSHGSPTLFAVSTGLGTVLAIVAYLLAVERTEEYAEQLRATVDLHHTKLRDAWVSTIPDVDLEHWFDDARAFVEGGRDSLIARRNTHTEQRVRVVDGAASGPAAEPSETREGLYETNSSEQNLGEPPRHRMARVGSAWGWVCERVRLLWAASAVAGALIVAGSVHLATETRTVLVAAQSAQIGTEVVIERDTVRAVDVPQDAVSGLNDARVALRPLQPGEVITMSNTLSAANASVIEIATTAPRIVTGSAIATVIVAPCGRLLHNVIVTVRPEMSPTHVELTLSSDQVGELGGCSPESVALLTAAGG